MPVMGHHHGETDEADYLAWSIVRASWMTLKLLRNNPSDRNNLPQPVSSPLQQKNPGIEALRDLSIGIEAPRTIRHFSRFGKTPQDYRGMHPQRDARKRRLHFLPSDASLRDAQRVSEKFGMPSRRYETTHGTAKNKPRPVSYPISADSAKRRLTTPVSFDADGIFYDGNCCFPKPVHPDADAPMIEWDRKFREAYSAIWSKSVY